MTLAILAALFPLVLLTGIWRLAGSRLSLRLLLLFALVALGSLCGYACMRLENTLWQISGLSLTAKADSNLSALLAMLLFAAPLEEGSKLAVVWTVHRFVRLRRTRDGLFGAMAVASGFAAVEALLSVLFPSLELPFARSLLGSLGHLFFAALWGVVLGSAARVHLLGVIWFIAMLMHGVFDHIVFGRGQGTLALLVPLLVMMTWLGALAIRELRDHRVQTLAPVLLAAPSLRELSAAIKNRERPLVLRWIFGSAFVTTGCVLSLLALAVFLGNRLGVDFAAASEADVRSNGPLVFLAVAVVSGFPSAGFLVARASGTGSVLEPAAGALLAIVAVLMLLSLTAPVAVVFALAVAPVAFGLACVGAWFGVGR